MYCPICGAESTQGLNYCKRCGSNLTSPALPSGGGTASQSLAFIFAFLFSAIVCVAGFIALFVTIVELSHRDIESKVLLGITAFGGATVVGVVGMFVWLLMRLTGAHLPSRHTAPPPQPTTGEPQQITAPPLSMPSVTENTTRNFAPLRTRERETAP